MLLIALQMAVASGAFPLLGSSFRPMPILVSRFKHNSEVALPFGQQHAYGGIHTVEQSAMALQAHA
jgi:hypothetical protein